MSSILFMTKPLHIYRNASHKIASEAFLDSSPNTSLKNRFYLSLMNLLLLQYKTLLQKGSLMWTKSGYIQNENTFFLHLCNFSEVHTSLRLYWWWLLALLPSEMWCHVQRKSITMGPLNFIILWDHVLVSNMYWWIT